MPPDVPFAFFSYCRADSEFALKLAEDLKAAGANVWMDQLDIEPGEPWDRSVEEAVTKSPRMLVILSPVSVTSDNVRDEVSFALSRQKRVIPVLYRDCDIPFRLARLQHIDFRTDYERGLKTLIRVLVVEHPAQTSATPAPAPPAVTPGSVSDAEEHFKADARALQEESDGQAAAEKAQHEELERQRIAAEKALLEQQERERQAAEEKARQEELERKRIAAEQAQLEEERRRVAAEKALAEQQQRERQAAAERLRKEELERKQAAAEQARLEQEQRERLAAAEKLRQEELERQRVAAEQTRMEEERRQAASETAPPQQEPMPTPEMPRTVPAKYPVQVKVGIAVTAVAVAGWLLYLAISQSGQQERETQKPEAPAAQRQESQPQTTSPPPSSQPASSEAQGGSPSDQKGTEPAKSSTSAKSVSGFATPPSTRSKTATTNVAPEGAPPGGLDPRLADTYRKAQAGDSSAMVKIGDAYEGRLDYKQAYAWYRKAAEAGDPTGMDHLAFCYQNAFGVDRDYSQALTWYRKSAEAGNVQAMEGLSGMYWSGQGVAQDFSQSATWARKAVDQGSPWAMLQLGHMYRDGLGVQRDYVQAVTWYRKAAESSTPYYRAVGMNELGLMYENGYGVQQDKQQAVSWYRKSAKLGDFSPARENLKRLGEKPGNTLPRP